MKALLLFVALALPTLAAATDPAAVAVGFLEKIRTGNVNLEPDGDTALSANTLETKRREITRRLERTALDLEAGTLEPAETKTDGDLAAVVIQKLGGYDPGRLRVFAVALVRKDGQWRPAPVPASFENSGIGFAPDLRKRASALEDWMLNRQAQLLDTVRQQLAERMRKEILASLSLEDLRAMTAEQAGLRFVDACAKSQLAVMLGLLGGLQPELPDNWSSRLQYANAAVDTPATSRPWRLLVAPDVIRTVVHQESDDKTGGVALACIDPRHAKALTLPKIELIQLDLERSAAGLWQVNPPKVFFDPPATTNNDNDDPFVADGDDDDQDDLLDAFPACLRKTHPLRPQPTFAAALTALQEALLAPSPLPLLGLLDLTGPAKTARGGCVKAIALWASLHDPAYVRSPVMLDSAPGTATGAASFQMFSVRQEHLDLRVFYFEQGDSGWHLLSGMAPDTLCQERFAAEIAWAGTEAKRWSDSWRAKVLSDSVVVAPAAGTPPTEADTRKFLESWFGAVASGDLGATLKLTARLDSKASPGRLLRNLGYEINTARKSKKPPVIASILCGKAWTVAAVTGKTGDKTTTAVYPVVGTPTGPRLLLEADLFISEERGREFLNKSSFTHVRDGAPAAVAEELETLFRQLTAAKPEP